jgi:hypothetical protein
MSRTVRTNLELLRVIVKLKPSPRRSLIQVADEGLVSAICECFLNIVNANIPLTPKARRKLEKYKRAVRSLASSRGSWKCKRAVLVKHSDNNLIPLVITIALKYLEDESR